MVVADGVCLDCGSAAPLGEYASELKPHGGWLVLDDTQALGMMGPSGGGSLAWRLPWAVTDTSKIVYIASLAKAFGVPVAVLAGSAEFVARYEESSGSRHHSSPPSAADVSAAAHALLLNESEGDARRGRLFRQIAQFRAGLRRAGIPARGGRFPLQALPGAPVGEARDLQAALIARGVRPVLLRAGKDFARVGFLITARHSSSDLTYALAAIRQTMQRQKGDTCHAIRADI